MMSNLRYILLALLAIGCSDPEFNVKKEIVRSAIVAKISGYYNYTLYLQDKRAITEQELMWFGGGEIYWAGIGDTVEYELRTYTGWDATQGIWRQRSEVNFKHIIFKKVLP